ncbi:MAG: hypothetical protein ACPLRP_04390 [Candidatus Bipolaricaulaceae bacterium]
MRKLVERAKEKFNELRDPEAKAEILEVAPGYVKVRISGTGCHACGYDEHAVDFALILGDILGAEVRVANLEWEEFGLRAILEILPRS